MLKVSIVIPTYNRGDMLRELLSSVVSQRHRPVEIVVVDDGSTDNTTEVVRSFHEHYAGGSALACVYERIAHGGAQSARNRGIEVSSGNVLMFVDSDDVLAVDGLAKLAEVLEESPELDYVYGRVMMTDERLAPLPKMAEVGGPFSKDRPSDTFGYHWHTMGALYRRECIDRVGLWNMELAGSQDWEFQARVKLYGGEGEFVDVLIGSWRQHNTGRVGTHRFRLDYAQSVVKACISILHHARLTKKCDVDLESRIARRLFIHAWEFGANRYPEERKATMKQAAAMYSRGGWQARLIEWYAALPAAVDRMPLSLIHKLQNRK